MKRFLVFPLALGICGALFGLVYFIESVIAQWPAYTFPSGSTTREKIFFYFLPLAIYGLVTGILVGFALAVFDLLRNRKNQSATNRLLANLFWCSCYVVAFATANRILAGLIVGFNSSALAGNTKLIIMLFWWLGTLWGNFTAIIWAAIRSIQTDDVLTPRVLRDKLRERARLN